MGDNPGKEFANFIRIFAIIVLFWLLTSSSNGQDKIKVLTGERVTDKTGKLMDDVYYKDVSEEELKKMDPLPHDDGVWPDLMAEDGIYSNFKQFNNRLGVEGDRMKNVLINLITGADRASVHKFYLQPVLAADEYSLLPAFFDMEEEKDKKIVEWIDIFLGEYRVNRRDLASGFIPLYVPRPPELPQSSFPVGFNYEANIQMLIAGIGQAIVNNPVLPGQMLPGQIGAEGFPRMLPGQIMPPRGPGSLPGQLRQGFGPGGRRGGGG